MYDPHTVAFDIKSPFPGKPSAFWPKGRRETWFTIWHHDPELSGRGNRTDDSCGWFRPPSTEAERETIRKLAAEQYTSLYAKQCAKREGASYAYTCFEPSAYDAVYWSWRAIKHADRKRGQWRYGEGRNVLTAAELQSIYTLSANPVDNIRVTAQTVKNGEDFEDLFFMVWNAYRRHHRPWFKHPRWHVHHWHVQWHWLQDFNRWAFARCDKCGGRFGWGESPTGTWGGDKIWHSNCDGSHTPAVAAEHVHAD